jgi:hypothetical protein
MGSDVGLNPTTAEDTALEPVVVQSPRKGLQPWAQDWQNVIHAFRQGMPSARDHVKLCAGRGGGRGLQLLCHGGIGQAVRRAMEDEDGNRDPGDILERVRTCVGSPQAHHMIR